MQKEKHSIAIVFVRQEKEMITCRIMHNHRRGHRSTSSQKQEQEGVVQADCGEPSRESSTQ